MENNFNKFDLEDDEDIEIDLSGWKLNENFQQEENDRMSMILKEMGLEKNELSIQENNSEDKYDPHQDYLSDRDDALEQY